MARAIRDEARLRRLNRDRLHARCAPARWCTDRADIMHSRAPAVGLEMVVRSGHRLVRAIASSSAARSSALFFERPGARNGRCDRQIVLVR